MMVELKLRLADQEELEDLTQWLGGLSGIHVQTVERPAQPNSQSGTMWDFLAVVCEAGGPAVAAVRALQLWIEARTTTVEVELDGRRIVVTSTDAAAVLPAVAQAARVLGSVEASGDGVG
jgi:Effector Associated Constant Component 1